MDLDLAAIREEFLAESEENLATLEESLIALDAAPEDTELLGVIFRAAHTIKGNANSLGYDAITTMAHAMEDVLGALRGHQLQHSPSLVSKLLTGVDAIRDLVAKAALGVDALTAEQTALVAALRRLESGQAGPAGPAVESERTPSAPVIPLHAAEGSRNVRVDIDRLDRMLNLIGEITIFRGRLGQQIDSRHGTAGWETVNDTHREGDRLFMDLQEQVMKLRMVPIGPRLRKFSRMVRDLSMELNKPAALTVTGEDVEIDARMFEKLKDPLTQMIRNALAHGIEKPGDRAATGKPAIGRIELHAAHEAGSIVLRVADDGAGLRREQIIAQALRMGLIADGERMSDNQVYNLLFEPGFSTAETVTDVSGRGVGLDIVKRNLELLHGAFSVESKLGAGTTFAVRLPLTMAIIDGFAVTTANETLILPIESVVEVMELQEGCMAPGDELGVMSLRGEPLPLIRIGTYFKFGASHRSERESVVVARHGERLAGMVVDELLGEQQTVIKPLSKIFQQVPGVAGSAVLGNGRVALIMDVAGLLTDVIEKTTHLTELSA